MASSNLVGPGASPGGPVCRAHRRGPERLGYLAGGVRHGADSAVRVRRALPDRTPRPRRIRHQLLLRAGAGPVIAS